MYSPIFHPNHQALMMLMVEKVSIFFPRMCQKLERFYKSVVEEALLGRYPDVAEDFTSGAAYIYILYRQLAINLIVARIFLH